jgi:hypothetical protein
VSWSVSNINSRHLLTLSFLFRGIFEPPGSKAVSAFVAAYEKETNPIWIVARAEELKLNGERDIADHGQVQLGEVESNTRIANEREANLYQENIHHEHPVAESNSQRPTEICRNSIDITDRLDSNIPYIAETTDAPDVTESWRAPNIVEPTSVPNVTKDASPLDVTQAINAPLAPKSREHLNRISAQFFANAKVETQLLSRLYDRGVPAIDIALVINTLRGGGGFTDEEEDQLLQRLCDLHVPYADIALIFDAMRKREDSRRKPDDPEDAPPEYDFKAN